MSSLAPSQHAFADRGPDQIGILVADLDAALRGYERFLAGEWRCYEYAPATVPRLGFRGRPGEYTVRIALNASAPQVELLEPGRGPSIYHESVERRGYGIHHLGFFVPSLAAAIDAMAAAGYGTIQDGSGYGLDGDGGYAYFDTEDDLGIVLEAIEVPRRRRPPDSTWPPARYGSSIETIPAATDVG